MLVLLMSSRMSLSVRWPLNCCGGRGGGCRQGGSALEAGQVGQSRSAIGLPGGFTARRAPGAARRPVLGVGLVLALCPGIVRQWEGAPLPGQHGLKGRDTRLWKSLRTNSSAPPPCVTPAEVGGSLGRAQSRPVSAARRAGPSAPVARTRRPPNRTHRRWAAGRVPARDGTLPPVQPSLGAEFPTCSFPSCCPPARGINQPSLSTGFSSTPLQRSLQRRREQRGASASSHGRDLHPPARRGRPRAWSSACPRWTEAAWSRGTGA